MKLFLIYWIIMLFLEKKNNCVLICKLDQLFNRGAFCHLLSKPSSKPSTKLVMKNVFSRFLLAMLFSTHNSTFREQPFHRVS